MEILKIQNPNDTFDVQFSPNRDAPGVEEGARKDTAWVELIDAFYKGVSAYVGDESLCQKTAESELRNMQRFLAIDSREYYITKTIGVRVTFHSLVNIGEPLTGIVTVAYLRPEEVRAAEGGKAEGKVRLIGDQNNSLPPEVMRLMREAYFQKFPEEVKKIKPKPAPKPTVQAEAPVRVIQGKEPLAVINHALMRFSHEVNRAIVNNHPKELSFIINQSIQYLRDELVGELVAQPRMSRPRPELRRKTGS